MNMLIVTWFLILFVELGLYILLDGADLGIGFLTLFAKTENEKTQMMNSFGPFWDANETWVVIAAGTLFGIFPLAYGIVLSALYIPIFIFLFGIILRAVSYEFREQEKKYEKLWGNLYGIGSFLVIFSQGLIAGSLFSGLPIVNGKFVGSVFGWFNLISIFIAIAVLFGYTFLGYTYLLRKVNSKTIKDVHFSRVTLSGILMMVLGLFSLLLIPFFKEHFWKRLLTIENNLGIISVFVLMILVFLILLYATFKKKNKNLPYVLALILFALTFLLLLLILFPYILPPSITIFMAAPPGPQLVFMLIAVGIILPFVLFYNLYIHWIFRGKVEKKDFYED